MKKFVIVQISTGKHIFNLQIETLLHLKSCTFITIPLLYQSRDKKIIDLIPVL